MSIHKFLGTASDAGLDSFITFLNANKEGTFLENATITKTTASNYYTLTIAKDTATLTINYTRLSTSPAQVIFTNGTITTTTNGNASSTIFTGAYVTEAILSDNGLMFKVIHSSQILYFTLTTDSNGAFAFIKPASNTMETSETTNCYLYVGDSTDSTTLSLTPTYGTQKTGLIPAIINTPTGNTTIPVFYFSMQTQLPTRGLQAGRMDGSDYITNGYCFVRD